MPSPTTGEIIAYIILTIAIIALAILSRIYFF